MRIDSPAAQRLAPALVALAAIAVYANSLANGFAFDDVFIIQQNTRVHDVTAWRNIWLTPYWPTFGTELGLYRPFIIFVYAVQWAIGDGAAWVFHLGNVLLHAFASVLVYLLIERVVSARLPAFIAALLFAAHPVHTEAVANIVGQAELVVAIALLAACLVHVTRPEGVAVSWPRRAALVGLFAIGLATKESAVVLPGLLVALDFAQRRVRLSLRGLAEYADAMLMPVLLLGFTLAFYLVIRFDVMSGSLIGVDAAPSLPFLREEHRVLNALRAFPEFVRLLFFPQDLAVDYSPGVVLPVEEVTMMALFGAALLVGVTALALATPWMPSAGLPAAWFLISIITVSNLFFPIGVLIAERTLYVPSVAFSMVFASAWIAAAPRASLGVRRFAPALAAIIFVLFGVRTWIRNPDWDSTHAVLSGLVRDHPESYRAQWVQASILWQTGHKEEADFRWRFAHRIYPRDSQFLLEYGSYLLERNLVAEAVPIIEQSYQLHPNIPRTVTVLAYAYIRAGRWQDALARIADAETYGAFRATSMPLRAHAYHGLGKHDLAVGAWRVALKHSRLNTWVAWGFLARTLAISGYQGEAFTALEKAREVAKDSLGQATLKQLDTAIRDGCYEGLRAEAGPANGEAPAFTVPACDPLGDYFNFASRPKNATQLQNANFLRTDSVVRPVGQATQTRQ